MVSVSVEEYISSAKTIIVNNSESDLERLGVTLKERCVCV